MAEIEVLAALSIGGHAESQRRHLPVRAQAVPERERLFLLPPHSVQLCVSSGGHARGCGVVRLSQSLVKRCSRFEYSEATAALKLKWYIHWQGARRLGGRAGLGRETGSSPMWLDFASLMLLHLFSAPPVVYTTSENVTPG